MTKEQELMKKVPEGYRQATDDEKCKMMIVAFDVERSRLRLAKLEADKRALEASLKNVSHDLENERAELVRSIERRKKLDREIGIDTNAAEAVKDIDGVLYLKLAPKEDGKQDQTQPTSEKDLPGFPNPPPPGVLPPGVSIEINSKQ